MAEIVDAPVEGNAAEVTTAQSTIPAEYQGKSVEEVAGMHQALQRKMGQMSEELGSLRQLADNRLLQPAAPEVVPVEDDFYTDPLAAVERIIDRKLQPFQAVAESQSHEVTTKKLDAEFGPTWVDTAKDPGFQEWVAKSKVRTQLFMNADKFDYDSAAELLGTWGELGNAKAENTHRERKAVDRDRKLRAVSTEKGSAQIDPRKILSRADLRQMMQNDPNRYKELAPEIRKAYSEGRVR